MLSKRSKLIRIDRSKDYLRRWLSQGFKAVQLKLVDVSCRECRSMRDVIFSIESIMNKDHPLFRITHPNCQCGLIPVPDSHPDHKNYEEGKYEKKQPPTSVKPVPSLKTHEVDKPEEEENEEEEKKEEEEKDWSPTTPQNSTKKPPLDSD